jgi:hypothetical protein
MDFNSRRQRFPLPLEVQSAAKVTVKAMIFEVQNAAKINVYI